VHRTLAKADVDKPASTLPRLFMFGLAKFRGRERARAGISQEQAAPNDECGPNNLENPLLVND